MVTVEEVWAALAEIPDPEIPVISLVDLGVVKDVTVEDGRVRVDFTPTFIGCPALDTMRLAMAGEDRRPRSRAGDPRPPRRLVVDRRHQPPAARSCARAGFAPPAPRTAGKLELVQLQRRLPLPVLRLDEHAAREPLRPDAVPLDPLLRRLSPAVRAVQDHLGHHRLTHGQAPSRVIYQRRRA